ncbi:MAG: hypothetical protein EZS28_049518, partial [Streblomastix strix]
KKPNYQIEVAGGAYVSLVGGGRGEERFIAKKSLSEYLRLQGDLNKDISHTVNNMSRPWVAFDICVISQCNTSVPVGQSGRLKILEAGGVLVHIERSAAKCNFQSSIFTGCGITTTPWTPVIFSTNIAPCIGQKSEDEIFEPLWDRELRNGKMGTGLVVAREETSPLIKANGVQFINCDGIIKNIYDPSIATEIHSNSERVIKTKIDGDEKQQNIAYEELPQNKVKIKQNFKQFPVLPSTEDISNLFIRLNNENNDNFVVQLQKGRFSSNAILLKEGTKLSLKGEGESLSSIMQKESSQHLFTLQDSQLDASEMRAELWGASASLLQCEVLERSIISGLRVSGCNSEFEI